MKRKPIVVAKPPFWRNKIFPWGWVWLLELDLQVGEKIWTDGYYEPGDGGDTLFKVEKPIDNQPG